MKADINLTPLHILFIHYKENDFFYNLREKEMTLLTQSRKVE